MHIILEIINCYLENKIMRERMMMGEDVCVDRQTFLHINFKVASIIVYFTIISEIIKYYAENYSRI